MLLLKNKTKQIISLESPTTSGPVTNSLSPFQHRLEGKGLMNIQFRTYYSKSLIFYSYPI